MPICKPRFTICLTMGLRPETLAQTLESLGDLTSEVPVIAINDFGDAETSAVFDALCPKGQRLDLGRQVGHHPAVDAMYERVETDYVLHLEDDWQFDRLDAFDEALALLRTQSDISSVCLRSLSDLPLDAQDRAKISFESRPGGTIARLDSLHPQWFGYTFNPHIAPLALWKGLGGFSQFKKERHISRVLRAQNRFSAFLQQGACHHIGYDSVANTKPPSLFKRIKNRLRGQA